MATPLMRKLAFALVAVALLLPLLRVAVVAGVAILGLGTVALLAAGDAVARRIRTLARWLTPWLTP